MEILIQGYPSPKTNTQEILLQLILYGQVSIFDFSYLSGFRTRVSELILTHELELEKEIKTGQNKFGNSYWYALHTLPEEQKEFAIELYSKLINRNT